MKIGELAKKTGCKVVTIRYYEKEGLLTEPERTESNYRVYAKGDVERLDFIRHCRRHGIKLDEIKKLLAFKDQPQKDCAWIGELVALHIRDVQEQVASLKHLQYHLEQLQGLCQGDGTGCGILKTLDDGSCCQDCEFHEIN